MSHSIKMGIEGNTHEYSDTDASINNINYFRAFVIDRGLSGSLKTVPFDFEVRPPD